MWYLVAIVVAILVGTGIFNVFCYVDRRSRKRHEFALELVLRYMDLYDAHIRRHLLEDKDWSWAEGASPIATIGIKEDFTLMTDEELREAQRMAGESERKTEAGKQKGLE